MIKFLHNTLIWLKLNDSIRLIGHPLFSFITVYLEHSYRFCTKHLIVLNLYYIAYTETTLKRLYFEFGLLGVWISVSIRLRK